LKGFRSGVERRRGRGLKARGGRRDATGNVLKDRRSPRECGRMGTGVTTGGTRRACFKSPTSFAAASRSSSSAIPSHGNVASGAVSASCDGVLSPSFIVPTYALSMPVYESTSFVA